MAYTRGTSNNIIVGAAALFTYQPVLANATTTLAAGDLPSLAANATTTIANVTKNNQEWSMTELLTADDDFRNVGFTSNGLELQFQPDFGEVQVDQILDVAKLYKQGMQVNMNTSFAEATLENLLFAVAGNSSDFIERDAEETGYDWADMTQLNLASGNIGECPVERGLVAVGPGTGDCKPTEKLERIYAAYRALSIESVTVSAKRDEASMFDVSFRLLPNDSGSYGKIVDRTVANAA